MDTKTKWRLNEKLNHEESIEIIKELFDGVQKKFNFKANKAINQDLYKLYQDFETKSDTNVQLSFSEEVQIKPFISFNYFEELKPSHKIHTENHTIYIYE